MLASGILGSSPWLRIQFTVGSAQYAGEPAGETLVLNKYPFQKSPTVTSSQDSGVGTLYSPTYKQVMGTAWMHRKEQPCTRTLGHTCHSVAI